MARVFLSSASEDRPAMRRRRELLESCNLRENPFVKTEPRSSVIDQVFIGRERELREAAMAVVDRPRNVLVVGGYGYGKNWRSSKVDQGVVSKLATHLRLKKLHQAFILTTGAATDDAFQQARHVFLSDRAEILILDAEAITPYLDGVRPLRDLLAETHRRHVLRLR